MLKILNPVLHTLNMRNPRGTDLGSADIFQNSLTVFSLFPKHDIVLMSSVQYSN